MPKTSTPNIISEVAIGRRMKGSEILIALAREFDEGIFTFIGRQPAAPGGPAAVGLTRAPSVHRYCPSTTTFSPAASPLLITASPSCIEATSTVRRSTVLSGLMTYA